MPFKIVRNDITRVKADVIVSLIVIQDSIPAILDKCKS